jgi:hypothetical protein
MSTLIHPTRITMATTNMGNDFGGAVQFRAPEDLSHAAEQRPQAESRPSSPPPFPTLTSFKEAKPESDLPSKVILEIRSSSSIRRVEGFADNPHQASAELSIIDTPTDHDLLSDHQIAAHRAFFWLYPASIRSLFARIFKPCDNDNYNASRVYAEDLQNDDADGVKHFDTTNTNGNTICHLTPDHLAPSNFSAMGSENGSTWSEQGDPTDDFVMPFAIQRGDRQGDAHAIQACIDTGSDACFITKVMVSLLDIPAKEIPNGKELKRYISPMGGEIEPLFYVKVYLWNLKIGLERVEARLRIIEKDVPGNCDLYLGKDFIKKHGLMAKLGQAGRPTGLFSALRGKVTKGASSLVQTLIVAAKYFATRTKSH